MSQYKETFKGNGAVTQALLEAGALAGGTLLGGHLIDENTGIDLSLKQALVVTSALAALGAVHGFMKGSEASQQFQEQNTLINEAVHKVYIEEAVEKVSHKVR